MSEYLAQIQQVIIEIERLLGSSFSLQALIDRLALWRGHPIKVEKDVMPLGMTGYIVALKDCDLICYKYNLDSTRRTSVILHEIAHILLGHIPLKSQDSNATTYREFRNRRDYNSAICKRMVGQDNQEQEYYTEILAGLLLEYIVKGENLYNDIFKE